MQMSRLRCLWFMDHTVRGKRMAYAWIRDDIRTVPKSLDWELGKGAVEVVMICLSKVLTRLVMGSVMLLMVICFRLAIGVWLRLLLLSSFWGCG
jgi:hypothetical protein